MRAFVVRASSSGHRQDSPCNRPMSDPSMAHLPPEGSKLLLEGYAAISLLIPFLKLISSIAAGEYAAGLDEDMGPEMTG